MKNRGLIAKKIGMTRMVDSEGQMIPVTLLSVEPQKVTKLLTPEKDGGHGIQVGYYVKPERLLNKPDLTRLRKANITDNFTRFCEFRLEKPMDGLELGAPVTADFLKDVSAVDVTGVTKGKGFQGALKRWHSARGRMTHGSRFHRRPGSLGNRSTPGRVFKGKKIPGHMGCKQRTIQNLVVVEVDTTANVIALRGSVPGHRECYVVLRPSVKLRSK
jgi:large subunit ribosomal protein L3